MKKCFILAIFALLGFNAIADEPKKLASSCRVDKNFEVDEVGLGDVLELAMCNNPQTRAAWLNAQGGEANYDRSLAAYYPQLNAKVGYDQSLMDTAATKAYGASTGQLSLSWLLYDFGAREATAEKAYQAMNSQEFSYNQVLQDVAYSAIAAYYQTLSAQEALNASDANQQATRKSFELASKKFELGMVSKADKLQAETAFVQAQLDTTRQVQTLLNTRANLAKLLGLSPKIVLTLAKREGNDDDEEGLVRSVDEILDAALKNRPDLKAQMANVKSAAAEVDRVRAGYLPSISASVSDGWRLYDGRDGVDSPSETSRTAGVSLTWNLFSGFETSYGVDAAKYAQQAAEENYRLKEQEVELAVVNAYNDYTTGLNSLSLAKKMFESAKENEAVALGSYQAGKGDIIRLMEAQSRLIQANKELISARYGLYIYKLALLRATGELYKNNIDGIE